MRRSFKDDPLYRVLFKQYVQLLLGDNLTMEFFVEGTRARTGKMLKPKFGILSFMLDAFYERKVSDLVFVPVTINYSRVLEGETFPGELLGEQKVKETLGRILGAAKILKMNFGKIRLNFTEPFRLT